MIFGCKLQQNQQKASLIFSSYGFLSSSCNQNAQIRAATMIKVLDFSLMQKTLPFLSNLPSSTDSVFWSILLKR
jgi:hypothetical protein